MMLNDFIVVGPADRLICVVASWNSVEVFAVNSCCRLM